MNIIKINQENQTIRIQSNGGYVLEYTKQATIEVHIDKNVVADILFLYPNYIEKQQQDIYVEENANVKVAYTFFHNEKISQMTNCHLIGEHCQVELASIGIISDDVHFEVNMWHKAKHSYGNQQHYFVVYPNASLEVYACGKIEKDMAYSQAYQTTRVLTLGKSKHCKVTPVLLIDEHNVKASHANSIGQPDSDQLYYLYSRGINRQQALALMSKGYMAFLVNLFENSELEDFIKQKIEECVHFESRHS